MVNRFQGEYFYLSNFYEVPVLYKGILYDNNEAAFQAQKTTDIKIQKEFTTLDPVAAKRKGKEIKLRSDWEQIKEKEMYAICLEKFTQHPDLAEKLLMTGNRPLEEGNTWNDKVWGTVNGVGKNKLGKILMQIRDNIRKNIRLDDLISLAESEKNSVSGFINEAKELGMDKAK